MINLKKIAQLGNLAKVDQQVSHVAAGSGHHFEVMAALFTTVLIVSNIVSIKVIGVGPAVFDAGTILFPVAYILGDVITEVYGFRRMRKLVITGVVMLAITSLVFWIVGLLPSVADWTGQQAYDATLGVVWRIIGASITAIFIGELLNSYVLAGLKIKYQGKYLWARIISSTALGSLIDTLIFSALAFAGTIHLRTLFTLMATVYGIKMLVEVCASPVTIRIIKWLKRVEGLDSYEKPVLLK